MAKLVGQHQQSSFTSPSNGDRPIDATTVKGNDNALVTIHNAHDNNATVHVQSGTTAQKPAAGTVGRMFYDTTIGRLEYDTGTAWVTQNFASGTAAARPAATAVAVGTVYFVTDTGLFSYSDGATWATLSPSSGPTGSGTTNYLPKWTGGTTLGNSGIYYRTIVGRTVLTMDPLGSGTPALLMGDYGSGSWVEFHPKVAAYDGTDYTYGISGRGPLAVTYAYTSLAYTNTNYYHSNGGFIPYANSSTIPAYFTTAPTANTGRPFAKRDNGFWFRACFHQQAGGSATSPGFILVGIGSNQALVTTDNTDASAATGHHVAIQYSVTAGEWRLLTSNNASQTKTSLVADTMADSNKYEVWCSCAAGTSVYDWAIYKNGSLLGSGTVTNPTYNPTSSTNMNYPLFGVNHTSAATTEAIQMTSLLIVTDA